MKQGAMVGLFALLAVGLVLSAGAVSAYRGDYTVKGPNCDEDRHEAMEQAFDNLDYDGWVDLMTEEGRTPGVMRFVDEDNFETFVQAHEAGMNGDFEKAAELRAELGLRNGPKDGTGMRNGQHSGMMKGRM